MKNWWEFEPTQTYTRKLAQQALKEDEQAQAQQPTPTLGEALRPFGEMAWGAVKPIFQALGLGGEYVGRPLRAAIGAAFEPGAQIQPTPGAGFFEPGGAYQRLREYYPQAPSLDPWGVEKFLSAEVLLDPLTYVGAGLFGKLGAGKALAAKGGALGTLGRGMLKAEDIIEMPGRLAMRGVGAVARPITKPLGAWAQEAMQKVSRLPREAAERAGRLAVGEAGMVGKLGREAAEEAADRLTRITSMTRAEFIKKGLGKAYEDEMQETWRALIKNYPLAGHKEMPYGIKSYGDLRAMTYGGIYDDAVKSIQRRVAGRAEQPPAVAAEGDWLNEQISEYRRPFLTERQEIEAKLGATPDRPLRAILSSPRPGEEAAIARWHELNREMAVTEKPQWQMERLKEYREPPAVAAEAPPPRAPAPVERAAAEVPTAGLREPPLPAIRPERALPELPAAAARVGQPAPPVPEPEIPIAGLERVGQPTIPAEPPIGPPTAPPAPPAEPPALPGFATKPPDPQSGWILPEVLPNAEIRRLHERPDYLRKIMDLGEEHFPPLAKGGQWIGVSGTNPTARVQVLYGTIRAEGEAAAMAGGARLRAFGDVDELFNVTNGIANVGGKRVPLLDVLENRVKGLKLSPEQLAYQQEGWQLTDNAVRLLYDNRIDVPRISVPGGHYWPRGVVARQMPDGTLEPGVIRGTPGGRWLAAEAGFEKPRVFETVAEARKEGFEYLGATDSIEQHLRSTYRRVANTRVLEEIIAEIPHKVAKKKPFGMVGLPGVPGRWWTPQDLQGVREMLQDTSFRLSEKMADVGGAISNAPRTMQTVFDIGPALLQLFGMATTHPAQWARAVGTAFKSGFDEAAIARFLRVPQHADTITRFAPYGLIIHGPEFPAELVAGAGQFLGKIPVLGGAARKGAAMFDNMMTAARVLMLESLDKASHTANDLADLVRHVNAWTGVVDTASQGIPRLQQKWESALLYAPRYYRATMMVMSDIVHGGLRGKLAREHMAKMVGAGLLGYIGLCKMLGQEPKLDPREKGQWLTFEIADQHVGIGGSMFMLLRTMARSIRDPEDLPDFAWQFVRGRLAPGLSTAMDVLRRQDMMGAPLDTLPKLTKRIVQDNLTPIWIQGVLESGERDWKDHVAVGAAELAGLRTFPVSVWTKRNRLSEEYAQETFGRPWAELSGGEQYQVQQAHPDLEALVRQSWAVGKERGYRSSMFWGVVEEQRQPFVSEISSLNEALQAGRLSGGEYREAIQDREMLMARIPEQLKATAEWADIAITPAERWTAAGKEGQPPAPATAGDQFTQEYYQIVADARDPQTGLADAKAIVRGREALKARYPAAVVATEMSKIDRKRHPLYVKARELNTRYYQIPKYRGLTEEQGDRADEFSYRYSYARRMNPHISASRTKAMLAQQDPEGYQLYRYSLKNRNPERKAFYAANPLLWRFYGELTGEEMEEIAPMLGVEMPEWGSVMAGIDRTSQMAGGSAMAPMPAQGTETPWYERVLAGAYR